MTESKASSIDIPQNVLLFVFVEVHAIVENIRQTYETETNDLRQILQLFDSIDSNEHMAEILRLRKRVDELLASKVTIDVVLFIAKTIESFN